MNADLPARRGLLRLFTPFVPRLNEVDIAGFSSRGNFLALNYPRLGCVSISLVRNWLEVFTKVEKGIEKLNRKLSKERMENLRKPSVNVGYETRNWYNILYEWYIHGMAAH